MSKTQTYPTWDKRPASYSKVEEKLRKQFDHDFAVVSVRGLTIYYPTYEGGKARLKVISGHRWSNLPNTTAETWNELLRCILDNSFPNEDGFVCHQCGAIDSYGEVTITKVHPYHADKTYDYKTDACGKCHKEYEWIRE